MSFSSVSPVPSAADVQPAFPSIYQNACLDDILVDEKDYRMITSHVSNDETFRRFAAELGVPPLKANLMIAKCRNILPARRLLNIEREALTRVSDVFQAFMNMGDHAAASDLIGVLKMRGLLPD